MKYSSLGAAVVVVEVVVDEGLAVVEVVVVGDVVVEVPAGARVVVFGAAVVVGAEAADGDVVGAGVDVEAATASRTATVTTLELSGDGRSVTSSRTLDTAYVASTIEASVAAAQAMKVPILRRT